MKIIKDLATDFRKFQLTQAMPRELDRNARHVCGCVSAWVWDPED